MIFKGSRGDKARTVPELQKAAEEYNKTLDADSKHGIFCTATPTTFMTEEATIWFTQKLAHWISNGFMFENPYS